MMYAAIVIFASGIGHASVPEVEVDLRDSIIAFNISVGGVLWFSSGTVTSGPSCARPHVAMGRDQIGSFTEWTAACSFRNNATDRADRLRVRTYPSKSAILFESVFGNELVPRNISDQPRPVFIWPAFNSQLGVCNRARWLAFPSGQLGSKMGHGGVATFLQNVRRPGPLIFSQSAAGVAAVLSPLTRPYSQICMANPGLVWGCGLSDLVTISAPANKSTVALLSFGVGVTDTMARYGRIMKSFHGLERRDPDPTTSVLSIYTDNGAFYNAQINGDYSQATLSAIVASLRAQRVPVRALQLDDFWYNGTDAAHMRVSDPWGNRTLYPRGISGLAQALDLPLAIYANHFSADFPMLPRNGSFAATSLLGGRGVVPVGASSHGFYSRLFQYWQDAASMVAFEVDFLSTFVFHTPAFQTAVEGAAMWLDGLASAAHERGVAVQFCTATAYDAIQALQYPGEG